MKSFSFSSCSIACSVKRVSRPAFVPGARNCVFICFVCTMSIPGMFFAALMSGQVWETMIKGPFLVMYFLPLIFPFPARTFFSAALSSSSLNPRSWSVLMTFFVLLMVSNSFDAMNG